MTRDTDIAYIAGIIDGEGYIGIKRSSTRGRATRGYHARIQVRMVDEDAISFVAKTLGGNYYRESAHAAKGRPLYCFQASDAKAETILRTVLPYLRVKRRVAEVVLALRELQAEGPRHRTKIVGYRDFPNAYGAVRRVANRAFSDEYVAQCEELRLATKDANRVGI